MLRQNDDKFHEGEKWQDGTKRIVEPAGGSIEIGTLDSPDPMGTMEPLIPQAYAVCLETLMERPPKSNTDETRVANWGFGLDLFC